LFYLKVYPTMELAGFLFGVAKSRPCTWDQVFEPILEACLARATTSPTENLDDQRVP
jgi:hypothetical protein